MGWVTEQLTGTKDGSNRDFTISATPVLATLSIFQQGQRLRRVVSMPSGTGAEGFQSDAFQTDAFQSGTGISLTGAQFVISSLNVTVGLAPLSGQSIVARYFND